MSLLALCTNVLFPTPSLPSNTSFFFSLLVACQTSWLGKTVAVAYVYWTVKQNSTHVQLATIQWKVAIFTTFISDSRLKNMVRSNLFFSYSVAAVFLPGWYHDKVDIMHLFTLILIMVQCVGAAIIRLIEIRYVLRKTYASVVLFFLETNSSHLYHISMQVLKVLKFENVFLIQNLLTGI